MKEPHAGKAIRNLQKARGLMDTVLKMAEDQRYCMDIIQQCNAITGIMQQTKNIILESHLETCGAKLASTDPEVREKFIQEILRACNVSQRRG
ncbi:metal-sensing transcriptional repressor [Candidatus Uhrbacteria bacterium]|nr:metal-sensing transcriptional repressor [Candidatus Uhrbacteria bacterium]